MLRDWVLARTNSAFTRLGTSPPPLTLPSSRWCLFLSKLFQSLFLSAGRTNSYLARHGTPPPALVQQVVSFMRSLPSICLEPKLFLSDLSDILLCPMTFLQFPCQPETLPSSPDTTDFIIYEISIHHFCWNPSFSDQALSVEVEVAQHNVNIL